MNYCKLAAQAQVSRKEDSHMQHRISKILPFVALAIPLLMLWLMPRWTVDDAFISYRYGANLQQFGELNWNPGEAPVEGYTGVLLPLLTALLLSLGAPLLMGIKIISTLATAGTALLLNSALKKLHCDHWIRLGALLLFLLSPLVYVHQSSGLETSIFAFLLFASFYVHFSMVGGPSDKDTFRLIRPFVYLLLLAALSITRPEGAFAAMLCLGSQLLFHWKHGQKLKGLGIALAWGIPAVLYFVWRLNYYGEWLPNSFAAKQSDGFINVESVKAAARFFGQYLVLPLAAAGLLWVLSADQIKKKESHAGALRHVQWVAGVFIAACLLVYLRSDLFMNYASRFFAPFFPLFLLRAGAMLDRGREPFQKTRTEFPRRHRIVLRLLLVAGVLQMGVYAFKWKGELNFVQYYQAIVEDEYMGVAEILKNELPPDATLICYMDAGAIPYYSGLRTIDFGRLNDRYLAREQPDRKEAIDYFFQQNADVVVMTSESAEQYVYVDEAMEIMDDPRFKEFRPKLVLGNRADFPYFQWIFLRKSSNY